jgi:hypothetical protein
MSNLHIPATPVPAGLLARPTLLPLGGAIASGLLLGHAARGPNAPGWLLVILLLSATIVALAQQTLP